MEAVFDLHANRVHARDDHVVERLPERVLIDVVLVLANADTLWIEFDQLGQRIHQPPADGHRAAHGDVAVREFLSRHL